MVETTNKQTDYFRPSLFWLDKRWTGYQKETLRQPCYWLNAPQHWCTFKPGSGESQQGGLLLTQQNNQGRQSTITFPCIVMNKVYLILALTPRDSWDKAVVLITLQSELNSWELCMCLWNYSGLRCSHSHHDWRKQSFWALMMQIRRRSCELDMCVMKETYSSKQCEPTPDCNGFVFGKCD